MKAKMEWEMARNSVMAVVATGGEIDDASWNGLISDMRTTKSKICFVNALGSPRINAVQRKAFIAMLRDINARVVAIIGDPVSRGIATAIAWCLPGSITVFSPGNINSALSSLGVSRSSETEIRESLCRMQNKLSISAEINQNT